MSVPITMTMRKREAREAFAVSSFVRKTVGQSVSSVAETVTPTKPRILTT